MKFVKGQSGNLTGRPKQDATLTARARDMCDEVLTTWYEIMSDKRNKSSDRTKAGENIYNRAYGTPLQSVNLDANVQERRVDLSGMKAEQLDVLLEAVTSVMDVPPSDSVEESEESTT